MLSLINRTCRIGNSINTRSETHGEEFVTALDIPIGEIMLEPEELNAILQEPHAHGLLYATKPGAPAQPVLQGLKALRLEEKIEGAEVVLRLAGDTKLRLIGCKLARIDLKLEVGGLTAMRVQVQCVPKLDSSIARLIEKLNCEVEVEIRAEGFGDQQKLPLEQNADPAPVGESRTHRKIRAADASKRRRERKNGHAEAS